MGEATAGQSIFGGRRWISRLLARFGLSSDPDHRSLWVTLLVVGIISIPPLLLSVLSGTAWGTAVDIPFLHDANSLVRLFVVVPVLVVAANAVGVQLAVAMSYLDGSSLIGEADRPEYADALAVLAVILFMPFGALALTQVSLSQLLRAMASKAF